MKSSAALNNHVTHRPPRPAEFIRIAPRSRVAYCTYCGKPIYFAPHPSTGKPHPVALDLHPAAYAPTSDTYGQGITHFADKNCPRSAQRPRLPHTKQFRRHP